MQLDTAQTIRIEKKKAAYIPFRRFFLFLPNNADVLHCPKSCFMIK